MVTFKEFCDRQTLLNEMFVYGTKDVGKFIIATRKDIFIFDEDDFFDDVLESVLTKLKKDYLHIPDNLVNFDFTDIDLYRVIEMLRQYVDDLFFGYIIDDTTIEIIKFDCYNYHSPISSEILNKISWQLKIDKWKYSDDFYDDEYQIVKDVKLKEKFPDIGYHGTSSKYLGSILRVGLRYDQSETNWENITQNENHRKTLFFSTSGINALFHANRAFSIHNKNGDYTYPIIVEFQIPSKKFITHDFDMERISGTTKKHIIRYEDVPIKFKKAMSDNPISLSREFGIYGYTNPITPKFITAIWVPKNLNKDVISYDQTDFVKMLPKEAAKHLGIFTF